MCNEINWNWEGNNMSTELILLGHSQDEFFRIWRRGAPDVKGPIGIP